MRPRRVLLWVVMIALALTGLLQLSAIAQDKRPKPFAILFDQRLRLIQPNGGERYIQGKKVDVRFVCSRGCTELRIRVFTNQCYRQCARYQHNNREYVRCHSAARCRFVEGPKYRISPRRVGPNTWSWRWTVPNNLDGNYRLLIEPREDPVRPITDLIRAIHNDKAAGDTSDDYFEIGQ